MASSNPPAQSAKDLARNLIKGSRTKVHGAQLLTVAEFHTNLEIAQQWAGVDKVTDVQMIKDCVNNVVKQIENAAKKLASEDGVPYPRWRNDFNRRRLENKAISHARHLDDDTPGMERWT